LPFAAPGHPTEWNELLRPPSWRAAMAGRPAGIEWMEAGDELSSIDCATIVRAKERWRVDAAASERARRTSERGRGSERANI